MLETFIKKMRKRGLTYAHIEQYQSGFWQLSFEKLSDPGGIALEEAIGNGRTLAAAIAAVEQDWQRQRKDS